MNLFATLLNESFEKVYFINGNHDLYYRDTRTLNSIEFNKLLSNFVQINEPIVDKDVAFVPWLVGEEWKKMQKLKCKYMFGHFELPNFYMNAMITMPDHGGLKEEKKSKSVECCINLDLSFLQYCSLGKTET